MNTIKHIAVIGSGYFSQFHYAAWQRIEGIKITGMHTLDDTSGDAICQRFGVPERFGTLKQLIDSKPDLVDVIVPPDAQHELLCQLADNNITTICQKPFCRDLQQAQMMVDYFAKRETLLIIHENFRHQPWYRVLRRCMDEHWPGELYQITFRLRPGDGQGADAYLARQPYFREQPEFLVRETAVHLIDVFRFLSGEIHSVFADLVKLNPAIRGEDAGIIMIRFDNGARGLIDGNRLSDHASDDARLTMGEMSIEGENGELTLDGLGRVSFRKHGQRAAKQIHFEWNDNDFGGDCVFLTQKHIIESLNANREPENTAKDYLVNRYWERQIYESSASGRWMPGEQLASG